MGSTFQVRPFLSGRVRSGFPWFLVDSGSNLVRRLSFLAGSPLSNETFVRGLLRSFGHLWARPFLLSFFVFPGHL